VVLGLGLLAVRPVPQAVAWTIAGIGAFWFCWTLGPVERLRGKSPYRLQSPIARRPSGKFPQPSLLEALLKEYQARKRRRATLKLHLKSLLREGHELAADCDRATVNPDENPKPVLGVGGLRQRVDGWTKAVEKALMAEPEQHATFHEAAMKGHTFQQTHYPEPKRLSLVMTARLKALSDVIESGLDD
jgi:hypothetical protein